MFQSPEQARPIVLVHGMWMTPLSWQGWVDRFTAAGHRVIAPAWPGLEGGVDALRADPSALAGLGVTEIVDHYERIIRKLDTPPILMGHSYGGAFVQMLLDRGVGAAGVAIHSAGVKGVYTLPLTTLRSVWTLLANPWNARRAVSLSPKQFHYAFTNTLSERASNDVYERLHVPGSGRALFQGALANLAPRSAFKVNFENGDRAPLLFIAGDADRILPVAIQKENVRRYDSSGTVTDYVEFQGRSHYTLGQDGWEAVADHALRWARAHSAYAQVTPISRARRFGSNARSARSGEARRGPRTSGASGPSTSERKGSETTAQRPRRFEILH